METEKRGCFAAFLALVSDKAGDNMDYPALLGRIREVKKVSDIDFTVFTPTVLMTLLEMLPDLCTGVERFDSTLDKVLEATPVPVRQRRVF